MFFVRRSKMRIPKDSFLLKRPIAHRGLHGIISENSMPAFEEAARAGYAIETDVRLSADGKLILFHDSQLLRMTGAHGRADEKTFDELKTLRLKGSNECIPLLADLLQLLRHTQTPLLLELKDDPKRAELTDAVLHEMKNFDGEFALQSFDPRILLRLKKKAPHILRGQLGCFYEKFTPQWYIVKHMSLNFLTDPDFISYRIQDLPYRPARRKDTPLLSWTVKMKTILSARDLMPTI